MESITDKILSEKTLEKKPVRVSFKPSLSAREETVSHFHQHKHVVKHNIGDLVKTHFLKKLVLTHINFPVCSDMQPRKHLHW